MASSPSKTKSPKTSPAKTSPGKTSPKKASPSKRSRASLGASELVLPSQRVKMIMKSCPDVETVPQETLHLITKATELFVEYLAARSTPKAAERLDYDALSTLVHSNDHLEFLREAVPQKVTWEEAQKLIEENSNRLDAFF